MEDGQDTSQSPLDWTRARSRRARSHAASFAISIAAHAVAFAAILYFGPAISKPHSDFVLAYLVDVRDGSSGRSMRAGAPATLTTPIRSDAGPMLLSTPRRTPHHTAHTSKRISHSHREYEAKASDTEAATLASRAPVVSAPSPDSRYAQSNSVRNSSNAGASVGAGGSSVTGSGSGSTDGAGDGDGTSIAHADYGKNPPPTYPAIARRRAQQGTVTIRVLVGIDGIVQRAEIAESSGFDVLDDAAIETVRRRWRFVPAHSAGNAIESWVLVPIRFALTEAHEANATR
ncbi:MAG TPA: energy transducer TonB [Sporolactobacillaceae bacterium]|nr:energy transducer TonB [Sporolactobacillaceae bacterium]